MDGMDYMDYMDYMDSMDWIASELVKKVSGGRKKFFKPTDYSPGVSPGSGFAARMTSS